MSLKVAVKTLGQLNSFVKYLKDFAVPNRSFDHGVNYSVDRFRVTVLCVIVRFISKVFDHNCFERDLV